MKKHGKRVVDAMYKKYTQLEDIKLVGELYPNRLTISQNKGSLRAINLIKKRSGKLKREDIRIWTTP